ncbi:MAG TPA: uridine kinase [Clostridia bacterium]|nr:uridine kinase [Clostridia bacterium]
MKPYLIGIAGPSCAGKSYLCKHIAEQLGAATLHIDAYYRELNHLSIVQRAHWNFDAPDAIDSELLFQHVRALYRGAEVEKPVYDFTTHARTSQTETVEPRDFIIIEGLFALYWDEIRKFLGTRVYVDLGEDICLERRIERDIRERGRTRESVLEQYHTTVAPMAKRYVYPTRDFADIVVTGDDRIENEVGAVLNHVLTGSTSSTR